jgi:plastocyanin
MRHTITLLFALAMGSLFGQAISTQGFTFSPDLISVQAGTDINVSIGGGHTMTEVSEATWNANGSTSNGGFNFISGNHVLNLSIPGTYYYVCQPHASMGMKGRIIVETNTSVAEQDEEGLFTIFPNPASEGISIAPGGQPGMTLRLIDAQGREALVHRLVGADHITIAHLAKGTYIALLHDARGNIVARRPLTIAR